MAEEKNVGKEEELSAGEWWRGEELRRAGRITLVPHDAPTVTEELKGWEGEEDVLSGEVVQVGDGKGTVITSSTEAVGLVRAEISQLMDEMTDNEIRCAIVSAEGLSRSEQAEALGLSYHTVKKWNIQKIDELASLINRHRIEVALSQRERLLTRAVAVKAQGLQDPDPKVRQKVATEIIEWNLGKAGSRSTVEHAGVVAVEGLHKMMVKVYGDDDVVESE